MKSNRGTAKAVLFLIQEIAVVIAAIAAYYSYLEISRLSPAGSAFFRPAAEFERSDEFQDMVQDRLDDIVRESRLLSNFQQNGRFYGRKIVDLAEYVQEGRISGLQKNSVGYYLEDLIRWSRKGLKYSFIDPEKTGRLDAKTMMPEFYDDELWLVGEEEDVEVELIEEYEPVRGRGLFDYANDNYSKEDLLELLEQSLLKIGEDYQDYQELGRELAGEKTNVRYFLEDYGNKSIFTNFGKESFKENDTIKTYGRYIILDSRSLEYESNMRVTDAYLYGLLQNYERDFQGNYYLEFGVDTSYPVMDSFAAARDAYGRYLPRINTLLGISFFTAVFAIIALLCLTVASGGGDGEMGLMEIDHIKTEPFIVFFTFLVGAGSYYLIRQVTLLKDHMVMALFLLGIGVAFINLLFLTAYLSLVRRIKAGTLYSESLLCWFINCCRYISHGLTIGGRRILSISSMLLVYLLFVAVNAFFIYRGSEESDNRYFIAAAIFDAVFLVYLLYSRIQRENILKGIRVISKGNPDVTVDTGGMDPENMALGAAVNAMSAGLKEAMRSSIRNEKLQADLITNVSHDLKTPLTSIVNYVNLLKQTDISSDKAKEYVDILDKKTQRLKVLTEDLVEASRISSGNIEISLEKLDFCMFVSQIEGEFFESFQNVGLILCSSLSEETLYIEADGRRLFRVLDNIYQNVVKYAMPGTRVYADLKADEGNAVFSLKNISRQQLNIEAEELTERFIRGDVSRSSEGSGLGLSIARNLTEIQGGTFNVYLDGDLFKVTISFPLAKEAEEPQ